MSRRVQRLEDLAHLDVLDAVEHRADARVCRPRSARCRGSRASSRRSRPGRPSRDLDPADEAHVDDADRVLGSRTSARLRGPELRSPSAQAARAIRSSRPRWIISTNSSFAGPRRRQRSSTSSHVISPSSRSHASRARRTAPGTAQSITYPPAPPRRDAPERRSRSTRRRAPRWTSTPAGVRRSSCPSARSRSARVCRLRWSGSPNHSSVIRNIQSTAAWRSVARRRGGRERLHPALAMTEVERLLAIDLDERPLPRPYEVCWKMSLSRTKPARS